ncbi:MAG: UbiD family decarboxylase [Planctomycetota bacterium]|jgi:4-hydroxy-3-polyprenylbenzoate decarboxylase
MPYRCLADFLEELGHAGELVRVEAEVEPALEAAEITRRTARTEGPALLFGAVRGHEIPLLTNLLGTEARICRALGVGALEHLRERIATLVDPAVPEGWFEKLKTAPHVATLANLPPRRVRSGACQQIVRLGSDVDLGELPALQSAPDEAHRAITAAAVLSAEAESGRRVAGRFDLQLLGRDRLAVCWAGHDQHARLLAQYGRRDQKMALAVVLGGNPAGLLAAAAPMPPGVDAWALAGLLQEKPIDVVRCRTVELDVPAEAEIVVEGHVDPAEPPVEAGPLCTPLGHYAPPRPVPAMHVTAITHRANPVFPAIVPGPPPHEACMVQRALARVFLPLVKLAIPELVDYDLPTFAAARHWATLSIEKTYAGQARRVAQTAWGLPQLMPTKLLVVVDEGVDVRDHGQVLSAITANVNPGRDVLVQQGPPDPLDIATPPGELGHKMAVDATAKLPGEHAGPWPEPAVMSKQIQQLVSDRWPEYGLGPEPKSD